ncbi:RE1-silencing transcription factor [Fukomys damarensis]|uniref:RE1-silencing transcription factor n=1 Tax=Fukomys damarensis TaxID=885580 RepID=A0A091D419_FUKDA|nr:RE1-silencing transcription factor [Fukomys damarensis]
MAHKEQVLIEVGFVPVKDSQLLKESAGMRDLVAPLPQPKKEDNLLPEDPGKTESPLQKKGAEEADRRVADGATPKESAGVSAAVSKLNTPEGETSGGEYQTHSGEPCEIEMVTEESTTENLMGKEATGAEPASPSLFSPPVEECETVFKTALSSAR